MEIDRIFVGGGGANYAEAQNLLLKYGNRHGLIAGATGTGKTITLQILAESFSKQGVPVFLADVKGDVAGMAKAGSELHPLHAKLTERAAQIGLADYVYEKCPVVFWDMFGKQGHPVRTTISEMGPLLLSRLLELTEPQEGVLNIAFRLADEHGLLLLDLKDLQAVLVWVGENSSELSLRYGNIAEATVGSIQRRLLVLENQGADQFFGEPALKLSDMIVIDANGHGQVNILAADTLMQSPGLYSTFLLWLLSELFEQLPEVGDPDKPKFMFFFDEAHLLFADAPKAMVDKVEQVARLIRSKGVGVFFISQNPDDVPEVILGQLGNRVQHALRAYTPRDQKALKMAAETFRPNPAFETEVAIRDVGTGEAVVSLLEAKSVPSMVQRTLIRPPSSQIGPITAEERAAIMAASPIGAVYDVTVDRESAYEKLAAKVHREDPVVAEPELNSAQRYQPEAERPKAKPRGDSVGTAFAKSFARAIGSRAGQQVVRGVLGGLFGKR